MNIRIILLCTSVVFSSFAGAKNQNPLLDSRGYINPDSIEGVVNSVVATCEKHTRSPEKSSCQSTCKGLSNTTLSIHQRLTESTINKFAYTFTKQNVLNTIESCSLQIPEKMAAEIKPFLDLASLMKQNQFQQENEIENYPTDARGAVAYRARPIPANDLVKGVEGRLQKMDNLEQQCRGNRMCELGCKKVKQDAAAFLQSLKYNDDPQILKNSASRIAHSSCYLNFRPLKEMAHLAAQIVKSPDEYNKTIVDTEKKKLNLQPNIARASMGYLIHNFTLDDVVRVTDSLSKRCQGKIGDYAACQSSCDLATEQGKKFSAQLNQSDLTGEEMRKNASDFRDTLIACNKYHWDNRQSRDERDLISQLQQGLNDETWPDVYRLAAIEKKKAIPKPEYAYQPPPLTAAVKLAKSYKVDSAAPVKTITKRNYDLEQLIGAYESVAQSSCNGDGNCEFKCAFRTSTRDALFASVEPNSEERELMVKTLQSWQCGGALKSQPNYKDDPNAVLVVSLQEQMEYKLWPADLLPYTNELRQYCHNEAEDINPFIGLPACEYASAIYYNDFETAVLIDRWSVEPVNDVFEDLAKLAMNTANNKRDPILFRFLGLMTNVTLNGLTEIQKHSWSVAQAMFEYYLPAYKNIYPMCLEADAPEIAVARQTITKHKNRRGDVLKETRSDPNYYYYPVNEKFWQVAQGLAFESEAVLVKILAEYVGGEEDNSHEWDHYNVNYTKNRAQTTENGINLVFELTKRHACDSALITKFEDKLIEYYLFKLQYAKLALSGGGY